MNIYLVLIVSFIMAGYLFALIVEVLNIKAMSPELPGEAADFYDQDKYKKSQQYSREHTKLGLISGAVSTSLVLLFIFFGYFNYIDGIARGFGYGPIITGLLFTGILLLVKFVVDLPFSVYRTFVIEQKYGFNKTTVKTFILDILKAGLLMIVIGGIALFLILWFFEKAGSSAWLYCWIFTMLFNIFLIYIYPVAISPLFNKFIPMEEGELKQRIREYAGARDFKLSGIFTMDGSKRSTRVNAYFTGFGRFRRIALYDTLISKFTVNEILAVLAHEVGHCKKKHNFKHIVTSFIISGFMFYLLSLFINNKGLFNAFGMEYVSVYASLVFFSFLYAPVSMIFSIASNVISRGHEFESDKFAAETTGNAEDMISALKKLGVENLANLTPHPLKVFVEYSHPPVLQRIARLKTRAGG